ncbi:MAG: 1,4-dihydroxy-6-naphthoate synthase [Bacteroidota bacterium]
MQPIDLCFSTCPNDTFMFDAMIHERIDTGNIKFNVMMTDIEELNQNALNGIPDVTKISFAVYPKIKDNYLLLNAGSAMGHGNGPLLIGKDAKLPEKKKNISVAIPGINTTARLLFQKAYPEITHHKMYLFSDIECAVLQGNVDAGVIIHENRFTYQKKGLKKIKDLGKHWEDTMHLPIPLGGIAIKRNLSNEIQKKINLYIRKSIEYAIANREKSYNFIKHHAQAMDDEVIRKHIDLYVNHYSLDLKSNGRKAVMHLLDMKSSKMQPDDIFVI